VRYGEGLRSVDFLFIFFEVKLICKIKEDRINHKKIKIGLRQDWSPAHGAKTTIQLCEKLYLVFGLKIFGLQTHLILILWTILEQMIRRKR